MRTIRLLTSSLTFVILIGITFQCNLGAQPLSSLSDTLYERILINPDKPGITFLSNIADSIWMLPLENHPNGMLQVPQKILVDDDKFFFLDKEFDEAVFCYSTTGKFFFKIDLKDSGLDDYSQLNDFTLDKVNKKVILYDHNSQAIVLFDYNGKYERTVETKPHFDFLSYLDGTRLLLLETCPRNSKFSMSKNKQLLIFDYTKNEVERMRIKYEGGGYTAENIVSPTNWFSESAIQPYFTLPERNTIWTLKEGEPIQFMDISFGEKTFPQGYLEDYTSVEQKEFIRSGTYTSGITNFQIVGNWIVGVYDYMKYSPIFFFNFKTGELFHTNANIRNNLGIFPIVALPPLHTDGNTIISVIPGDLIAALVEHPVGKNFVPKEISYIGEDDAPIIQFIRLK